LYKCNYKFMHPYIINGSVANIKHYSYTFAVIGLCFSAFPLGLRLSKATTIRHGISALFYYPNNVIRWGVTGGLFGTVVSINKYEIAYTNLDKYFIKIGEVLSNEMVAIIKDKSKL
jgi:hypothetical protein